MTIGEHVLNVGDVITIDGGTGRVIIGPVRLVPPAIDENFGTILDWADELRRLRVRANADTPEDAAKAREFGAEGIGLCRTEHMFMAAGPAADRAGDDPGARRGRAPRRARQAAADAAVRLRGHLRGDGRVPGHDPPARPAAARVPAVARGGDLGRRCAGASPSCTSRTRCSARAAAGSACSGPRSTRCRCARSCAPRPRWASAPATPPLVEIMHPLVGFREELRAAARADRAGRGRGARRSSTSAAR